MRAGTADLISVYGSRDAHLLVDEKIFFYDRFMRLLRLSFDTDDYQAMSDTEEEFYLQFVAYEDGLVSDEFVIALDVWIMNIINDVNNITIEGK